MNQHKALRSFYGASDRLKNTAKAHIGAGSDRPQEIYTPEVIVKALHLLWPEGTALDPCSGPDSLVDAEERWEGREIPVLDKSGAPKFKKDGSPVLEWDGRGLIYPWKPRTYVNPPYKDLKDWLTVALGEGIEAAQGELVMLIPNRTSRGWFREYMEYCTRFCLLDPLTFEGYAQSFPAPLVLTYHGDRVELFNEVCKDLGGCYSLTK